jgi:hypothetical protein
MRIFPVALLTQPWIKCVARWPLLARAIPPVAIAATVRMLALGAVTMITDDLPAHRAGYRP